MRYKPSAANLQEHPQRGALEDDDLRDYSPTESEPILGRKRAGTHTSGDSIGEGSLRSRGDLWPSSEDEDDAVVIGDDAFPRSSDADSGMLDDDELRDEEERLEREEEEAVRRKRERARVLAVQRGLTSESVRYSSGSLSQHELTVIADSYDPEIWRCLAEWDRSKQRTSNHFISQSRTIYIHY